MLEGCRTGAVQAKMDDELHAASPNKARSNPGQTVGRGKPPWPHPMAIGVMPNVVPE
jgi:hypothetical protein